MLLRLFLCYKLAPPQSLVATTAQPTLCHAPNPMLQELLQKFKRELEYLGGGGGTSVCVDLDPEKVRTISTRRDSMHNLHNKTVSPSPQERDESLKHHAKAREHSHAYQQTPARDIGDDPKVRGCSNSKVSDCSFRCSFLLVKDFHYHAFSLDKSRWEGGVRATLPLTLLVS